MVKDIKYIIKRILIGVGVVLVLSFLRGNLLISAKALEPINVSPNGMCWYSGGVAPDGCFLTPTQFNISWTTFYGNQFGADGSVERFFWRYYQPNIGGKYYNIDLLFYNGDDSSYLESNRGYIQNSANNTFSCRIDNTRWGQASSGSSSNASSTGTATVHCDNVYLTDDYFTFWFVDGQKTFQSVYAVTDATLTPTSEQTILDNQNENTEKEIESQKVCKNVQYNFNKQYYDSSNDTNGYLQASGNIPNNVNWKVSDFIPLTANSTYTLTGTNSWVGPPNYCIYDENETLESCTSYNSTNLNFSLSFPVNKKIRISYSKEGSFNLTFKGKVCQNGNQSIVDSNKELNDTLNNSSTDDPNNDVNNMNSKVASNNSITQLLTLPITLFQNVLNNINGSCSSYNLGSLFGTSLTLPCINLESILGSTLWGVIDVLISGLFILSFRKKMVDIFNHMSSLNDRGNELE